MLDLLKKELVSTIKWMFLISFGAAVYYAVVPKYIQFGMSDSFNSTFRMNQVTGQVYTSPLRPNRLYIDKDHQPKEKPNFWVIDENYKL